MQGIFVSYCRSDSADATGRIYDRHVAELGKAKVFKDVDAIPLGADFRAHPNDVVSQCQAVPAVVGAQWLDAQNEAGARRLDGPHDFVRIELEAALARALEEALRQAITVAGSLDALHRQGRVHGALHPDHILLTKTGVKLSAGDDAASPDDVTAVAYRAPEQLDGRRPRPRAGAAFIFAARSRKRRHNEAVERQAGTDVTCVIPKDREKQ